MKIQKLNFQYIENAKKIINHINKQIMHKIRSSLLFLALVVFGYYGFKKYKINITRLVTRKIIDEKIKQEYADAGFIDNDATTSKLLLQTTWNRIPYFANEKSRYTLYDPSHDSHKMIVNFIYGNAPVNMVFYSVDDVKYMNIRYCVVDFNGSDCKKTLMACIKCIFQPETGRPKLSDESRLTVCRSINDGKYSVVTFDSILVHFRKLLMDKLNQPIYMDQHMLGRMVKKELWNSMKINVMLSIN